MLRWLSLAKLATPHGHRHIIQERYRAVPSQVEHACIACIWDMKLRGDASADPTWRGDESSFGIHLQALGIVYNITGS